MEKNLRVKGTYNIHLTHMERKTFPLFGTVLIPGLVVYASEGCTPPEAWEIDGDKIRQKDTEEWKNIHEMLGPLDKFGIEGLISQDGETYKVKLILLSADGFVPTDLTPFMHPQ